MSETTAVPVQCWTPNTCGSQRVEKTNATVSVQFDKKTVAYYIGSCQCVEKK